MNYEQQNLRKDPLVYGNRVLICHEIHKVRRFSFQRNERHKPQQLLQNKMNRAVHKNHIVSCRYFPGNNNTCRYN